MIYLISLATHVYSTPPPLSINIEKFSRCRVRIDDRVLGRHDYSGSPIDMTYKSSSKTFVCHFEAKLTRRWDGFKDCFTLWMCRNQFRCRKFTRNGRKVGFNQEYRRGAGYCSSTRHNKDDRSNRKKPNLFGHMGSSLLGGTPFMGGGPFGNATSLLMGGGQFGSSLFGPSGSPFMGEHEPRGYEHRQSMPNTSRGLVIEELSSEDENDEQEAGHDHHMHGGSARQPYVEQPYDGSGGRELMQSQYGNQFNVMHDTHSHPQTQSFTFQSNCYVWWF